jgi:hypothetical protein
MHVAAAVAAPFTLPVLHPVWVPVCLTLSALALTAAGLLSGWWLGRR